MELIHVAEVLASVSLALFSYFGKRTLNSYDKRIEKFEDRDEKIMEALQDIQVKMAKIEVKLEDRKIRSTR